MALTYVGGVQNERAGATSTTTQSLSGTLTGGSNTSPSAGDLVVVLCAVGTDSTGTPTSQTISGDNSGAYTALTFQINDDVTYESCSQVSYKIQGATVDTSITIPSSANARNAQRWIVHVFRGVDSTTPMDVTATYATGSATGRPNPALIAPSTAGAWIAAFYASAAATGAAYTAPTDFATNWLGGTTADTADVMTGGGYYTGWTSGNYDPAAISAGGTTNATNSWTATTIAIRPSANQPPTVALNSPADASSGSDSTPTLNFTGTDADGDDIRYNVQVDTLTTFQTQDDVAVTNLIANPSFETLTGGWADDWTRTDTVFSIDTGGEGQAPTATNSLKVLLSSTSSQLCRSIIFNVDYTKTYYFSFTLKMTSYTAGSLDWAFDEYDSGSTWVSWQYKSYKNTTGTWQITGTYTPTGSSVAKAQLYFNHAASSTLTAYIDDVRVYERNTAAIAPKISITFDDAEDNVYTNRSIFSSRGIPITQYIISDLVGTTGYQTWTQIQETHDVLGWQIGNHSKTHADFTTLSEAQIVTEVSTAQSAISSNTGITPVDIAWPHGAWNALARQVASRYVAGMRDYSGSGENQPPYETTAIRGKSVENTDTVATVKTWIDAAIAGGYWLVLVFHGLVASSPTQYQWTTADMEALLDYINVKSANNLISPTTMERGRNAMVSSEPLISATSGTDAGFSGSPDNADPFASAQAVDFTVQAGDALADGTYYWRVRGKDPAGSNTYVGWSSTRSFDVDTSGGGPISESAFFSMF